MWLAIPLSVLVSWKHAALDQVGESNANPFEGGANDIPISQLCTSIELDLRLLLKIVVIGGRGLIGSRVVEQLAQRFPPSLRPTCRTFRPRRCSRWPPTISAR